MKKMKLELDENFHSEKISPNKNISGDKKEKELLNNFNNYIKEIENKFKLLDLTDSEDLKLNVLRGQVSLLLSSVDYYIHEIVKIELLNIIRGERKRTKALKNCMFSVEALLDYIASENLNEEILEEEIIYRNSYKSFLDYEKMKSVIALISPNDVFKELYSKLGFNSKKELEIKIKEIYSRRNDIVHQMDYNYLTNIQNSINKEKVEEFIRFYKNFVNKLHKLLIQENI